MKLPKNVTFRCGGGVRLQRIAANAPIAARQAKQAIHKGRQMGLADGLAFAIEACDRIISTADRCEGVAAFNEKRRPRFEGR